MADYTIKHLEEVADVLGDYPGEMRMMTTALEAEQVAFTYRRMPQHTGGKGSYGHRHKTQEEVYFVMSGKLQFKLGDEVLDDDFKEINDNHGHHVGDRALCEVARVLRAAIRPYDICVRYAGDEFIIVLSGCDAEEAERKRQELQKGIEDVHFEPRPGRPVRLGLSIGTAIFPQDGETYESLLATADSRMYQDKALRKSRVAATNARV